MPTNSEKEACLEILRKIEDRIPKRRYARRVQEYLKYKGKEEIPGIYKIQAVRNGRQFDLEIMKALREISKENKESDDPSPSKRGKGYGTANLFVAVK